MLWCLNRLCHVILNVLMAPWTKNNIFGFFGVRDANRGHTKYGINTHNTWVSRNDTDTNGLTEQFELRTIERFSEDVRLLVVCVNEFKTYDFNFHQIMDEVIANLYVLGLWVLNRILGKIYGPSVVVEHTHCFLRNPIVMKKYLHPKKLSTTTTGSYILGFNCR